MLKFLNRLTKGKQKASYTNEEDIEKTLFNLGIFLVFLILTTIVCFYNSNFYMYYFYEMIERLFITRTIMTELDLELSYEDLVTIEDWWRFMETTFLDGIHGEKSSNNQTQNSSKITENERFVSYSILLGPPRVRQLRVRNESCDIHEIFQKHFRTCYGHFSKNNEERNETFISSVFIDSSDTFPTWGKLTFYPGEGFVQNLKYSREENEKILEFLKNHSWIDRGTRFIAVEFNLYNANVNLFCLVKFFAEFPPVGGLIPWSQVEILKLVSLNSNYGYFHMVCLFLFYIMLFYYSVEEMFDMWRQGRKYFCKFWSILDLTIIVIGYLSLTYLITRSVYLKTFFKRINLDENVYISLDTIGFWEFHHKNMMAICLFLVWIKIFKFISFNKTMMQFSTTLKMCAKDLLGFGVMFFIVFVAFAQLGLLLFGSEEEEFKTFSVSVFTMLRMILGDFNFSAIEAANRVLGPIYFLCYIFLVFFILLNMFLAIINDTYTAVKSEIINSQQLNLGSYLKKQANKFVKFFCCGRNVPFFHQNLTENENENGKMDDEIKTKKDVSGPNNKTQTTQQVKEIVRQNEVIPKIFKIIDDEDVPATKQQINQLTERVNHLEEMLERILNGMDDFVNKLEKERNLNKKK